MGWLTKVAESGPETPPTESKSRSPWISKWLAGEDVGLPIKNPLDPDSLGFLVTGSKPTGAISAITNKPVMVPSDQGGEEDTAGIGATIKTGLVDDVQTKIDIFAKARGISPDRYGVRDGAIIFMGDDDRFYYEEGQEPISKLGQGLARTVTDPATIMGTIGAAGGPAVAALTSAGGEGVRKVIASALLDEPQTTMGNVKDLAVAGGLGYAGGKLGAKTVEGIDVTKGRKGAKLLKLAGASRERMEPKAVGQIEALAKKHGITLYSPQSTGSPELISRFNLLGDLPVTADKVGALKFKQYVEVNNSINKWLNSFAPPTTTPEGAGAKAVEAVKKGIQSAKGVRQGKAQAYYAEARKARGLDVSDTIQAIDDKIAQALTGSKELTTLKKIKNMLHHKVTGPDGKEVLVPHDELAMLDKVKKEINALWKKDFKNAPQATEQRSINEILNNMLKNIDEQVPSYSKARKIFGDESEVVTQLTAKKGKAGKIAALEGDDVSKVAKMLFSPDASSPEIIKRVMPVIVKQGGQDAWDALLRTHIKQSFRSTVKTGTKNIGGQLRKRLFGDLDQQSILKAAMNPEQFKNFEDLMSVFERVALTSGKESTTATRLVSLQDLAKEAGGVTGTVSRVLAYPLLTWKKALVDFRQKLKTDKYLDELVDLMADPKASTQLQSMLQLKPGTQKLIARLSTFLGIGGGKEKLRKRSESRRKNVLPPELMGRIRNLPPSVR